jgi:glycerate kinase
MADGGEGTLDVLLSGARTGGIRLVRTVAGATGELVEAAFGILEDPGGPVAVIEVAEVVGMSDRTAMAVPVGQRSTRGVGEVIRASLDRGLRRFLVGLGGSSTNDGGAGMLEALGVGLLDARGEAVAPVPATLDQIDRVDGAGLDPRLETCELIVLSDVDNPLCGPHGATTIFGPQKGVSGDELGRLDAAMARYAERVEVALGGSRTSASPHAPRISERAGSGAAGGLGFALQCLGATFRSGAEVVAERGDLDAALQGADWLITGEGRSDSQTLAGKAPLVAARHARAAGVRAVLVSGSVAPEALSDLGREFTACFAISTGPSSLAESIAAADGLLADHVEQLARLWTAFRG